MGNFKYKKREANAVKERANQSGGSFDSYTDNKIPRYKVQDGDNNLRIIPPAPDIDQERWGQNWGIELWLHNGVGSDKSSYLCRDKMLGKACALCERLRDIDDEDLVDKLKPKKRILCYVIDREDEKAGPQLFAMPWTLEKEFSGRSIDKSGAILYIDDPEEGYDISFNRTGTGLKTKYGKEEISRESTPLCDNQKTQDKWLQFICDNPMQESLKYYDNEHLKKVFAGQKSREDEDETKDEDEKPKRRRAKEDEEETTRPRRATRDEEEEEEKPRRRVKADEEEEEERPTSSRAASAETGKRRNGDARSAARDQTADDEEEEKPKRRAKDDDEEDERPRRRARDEEEEDEKPKRHAREEDEEEEKPKRPLRTSSRGKTEDEEEDETAAGKRSLGRLRDRASTR